MVYTSGRECFPATHLGAKGAKDTTMDVHGLMAAVQGAFGENSSARHALENLSFHILLAVLGGVLTWLVQWWRHSKYGKRVIVRVCWIEESDSPDKPLRLVDKVLLAGTALELGGSRNCAAAIVNASRRKRGNGYLGLDTWTYDRGMKVLNRFRDRISQMFAKGAVARAMHDSGVTEGNFVIAAFNRGDEISVVMARRDDLIQATSNMQIVIDGADFSEVKQLAAISDGLKKECVTRTKLYM